MDRFIKQTKLIDLVNEGTPETIKNAVWSCYQEKPTRFRNYELFDIGAYQEEPICGKITWKITNPAYAPKNEREQEALEKMQKGGAIFDIEKLNWMNGYYIRSLPDKKLIELLTPFFEEIDGFDKSKNYAEKITVLEKERLKKVIIHPTKEVNKIESEIIKNLDDWVEEAKEKIHNLNVQRKQLIYSLL